MGSDSREKHGLQVPPVWTKKMEGWDLLVKKNLWEDRDERQC